ncbi:MAG: hypothetical protein H5T50_07655 [Nitrososphaeria archaeon]|nr:hypothetical protein [Nitrososphaeria archaeon]
MLVLSSYASAVIALPTSLSPKWYKTLDGYFDDASVWYDGTVHVLTADWLTEFSCISCYTQVSPYGLVKSKYT